ncbi:MAG: UvrB/UvrC motif-containing protein [Phycisphaerales bacterium]|nr:MAG: UvrB/UvrC motif-containing protein [Phycisphaerales bacterium]
MNLRPEFGLLAVMGSSDIRSVLENWPYDPGHITVRKIVGEDGRVKVQMRLDLGLLQFELDGRPDAKRPHGYESLLHYHLDRLGEYRRVNGSDVGFELTPSECRELRGECSMYYHRYLSLFVLEEFDRVKRDTERNLNVLDLCRRYGAEERDRLVLQQFRPYLLMMNTRARVLQAVKAKRWPQALHDVEEGIARIGEFFAEFGQKKAARRCAELKLLRRLRRKIHRQLPVDPVKKLQRELSAAVGQERYEDAARIRDRIAAMKDRRRKEASSAKLGEGDDS